MVKVIFANFTSMKGTQPSSCSHPTEGRVSLPIVYCLFFLASFVGNIFIFITVFKKKTMRKPNNFFIVNMAVSDLVYSIMVFPGISTRLYFDNWLISGGLGGALCKLVPFFSSVSIYVSTQSLVLIAVDRFGAVVFPLRSPLISLKMCRFFIPSTWIVAMILQTPDLFQRKLVQHDPRRLACAWELNETFERLLSIKNYRFGLYIVFFYFPFILISILYIIIILRLKSQKIPGEQSFSARERSARERNVLKMSVAIVLVFLICWIPLSIYWSLLLFSSNSTMISSCGFKFFAFIAFLLVLAYGAINPWICFIFCGHYRQWLKNLFSCCLPRRPQGQ